MINDKRYKSINQLFMVSRDKSKNKKKEEKRNAEGNF